MTTFTKGDAPTINTNVLEELVFALIDGFGQSRELDILSNPAQVNYLESSITRDTMTAAMRVSFPCVWDGKTAPTFADYLTGVTYTNGAGSTFAGQNWISTLVNASVMLANLQRDGAKNPLNRNIVSWEITNNTALGAANATFSATYAEFPLTFSSDGTGGGTYKGAAYLL